MVRDLALEKEWGTRFEEYKKSGLSIKAWCAKNGFKSSTFQYWIKRFKSLEQGRTSSKVQFAEVIVASDSPNANKILVDTQKIYLSYDSYTVCISESFNPATLTELLKVLKSI